MSEFAVGDRVEFKTDYYGYAELDEGVGTILADVSCDNENCCDGSLYEVKVAGADARGIYNDKELTKID